MKVLSKLLKKKKKNNLLPPSSTTPKRNKKSQDPQTPPISPGRQFVTTTNNGQPIDDDDISAVTPATALPESPTSIAGRKRYNHNPVESKPAVSLLLGGNGDDDSSSHDFMVFEDKTEDNSSYGSSHHQRLAATGFGAASPGGGKLKVSFSDDANNNRMKTKNITATTPTTSAIKKKSGAVKNLAKKRSSILTKTTYFTKIVNSAFDKVDVDKSGGVTLEELYSGLLLIHLQMAIYVGAPACRPASKKYVSEVFHIVDTDNSGTLDRNEFKIVMQILYSQVFTRIVIQWTLTLMLVPVTTKYILQNTTLFFLAMHEFWKDVDDDLDPVQRLLWKLWESWLYYSPEALEQVGAICWLVLCKIPWKSMPPVILTVAQTSVALPCVLNHVEDFFRRAAHSLVSDEVISSEK
eukprot:scaffold6088_cov140-Skeletonema_dohrnii-CCMP3373.AAC.21